MYFCSTYHIEHCIILHYILFLLQGWDTGAVGMKKGGKRFLVIPPNLAYGSQGMGNKVPPNSTLLFEVEVVRVSRGLP